MVEIPKNEKQKQQEVLNSLSYSALTMLERNRKQRVTDLAIRWLNGELGMFIGVALGLLIVYVFFIDEPPSFSWQTWKAPIIGGVIGYTTVKLAVLFVRSRFERGMSPSPKLDEKSTEDKSESKYV